jgi:hypothetical protein
MGLCMYLIARSSPVAASRHSHVSPEPPSPSRRRTYREGMGAGIRQALPTPFYVCSATVTIALGCAPPLLNESRHAFAQSFSLVCKSQSSSVFSEVIALVRHASFAMAGCDQHAYLVGAADRKVWQMLFSPHSGVTPAVAVLAVVYTRVQLRLGLETPCTGPVTECACFRVTPNSFHTRHTPETLSINRYRSLLVTCLLALISSVGSRALSSQEPRATSCYDAANGEKRCCNKEDEHEA